MGSGGGGGLLKQAKEGISGTVKKWKQDPWEQIVNAGVNVATAGLAGYGDGKIKEGSQLHSLDEVVGEVSGRNKARAAGYEAERQIREAEALAAQQRRDELLARYRADLQASRGARGIRNTASARDRAAQAQRGVTAFGQDEQDVLGA